MSPFTKKQSDALAFQVHKYTQRQPNEQAPEFRDPAIRVSYSWLNHEWFAQVDAFDGYVRGIGRTPDIALHDLLQQLAIDDAREGGFE